MKNTTPSLRTTEYSPECRDWMPDSFDSYLSEIEFITKQCNPDGHELLFRGQTDHRWLLDCTLVRSILARSPIEQNEYPRSLAFHTGVVDVLLSKFGKSWQPSYELIELEESQNIDSMYELMKKFQQYPEEDIAPKEDSTPKGTFLIDWTLNLDIALYFATYSGRGAYREPRKTPGAVWICDPSLTGKVLQTQKLCQLLNLMKEDEFRLKAEKVLPLILHPPKQTPMGRAVNQDPVYFSQMDFRYDLADRWGPIEDHSNSVFRMIKLKDSLLGESIAYLETRGITAEYVYPE